MNVINDVVCVQIYISRSGMDITILIWLAICLKVPFELKALWLVHPVLGIVSSRSGISAHMWHMYIDSRSIILLFLIDRKISKIYFQYKK